MNGRRSSLKRLLVLSGLVAVWGGITYILIDVWMAAGKFSSTHWRSLVKPEELNEGGVFPFPEQKVALLVRKQMVAAISLECTHLGCLLNAVDGGFFCPCHGSEFGPMGQVYSGPANRSLPWHDLQLRQGQLWVQTEAQKSGPVWIAMQGKSGGAG